MCEEVTFGLQRMKRGQVWFCNEPTEVTNVLREHRCTAINGARPYFIVNVNGPSVNCIPMTTNVTSNDSKKTNIVFLDPISGIKSKLVIDQITTKGINEFNEYKYTFDEDAIEEIINRIKECIFGRDTVIKPNVAIVDNTDNKIDISKEEKESIPKPFLPDESKQLTIRLQNYFKLSPSKRKAEPMFRNQREALIFIEEFCDKPSDELCTIFGIDKSTVYRLRSKAKESAYAHK